MIGALGVCKQDTGEISRRDNLGEVGGACCNDRLGSDVGRVPGDQRPETVGQSSVGQAEEDGAKER